MIAARSAGSQDATGGLGRARTVFAILMALLLLFGGSRVLASDPPARAGLVIDIPTTLSSAKVVFNISRPAFEGDEPTGLSFLRVMSAEFDGRKIEGRIVAVFHGASGYILLDDAAYDRARRWQGGNPYKAQIAALQAAGVAFEECGKTMADNHWTNRDLLPGVRVNAGANFRIVELVQQGFVQIQP